MHNETHLQKEGYFVHECLFSSTLKGLSDENQKSLTKWINLVLKKNPYWLCTVHMSH
jgi:hypothetical protein